MIPTYEFSFLIVVEISCNTRYLKANLFHADIGYCARQNPLLSLWTRLLAYLLGPQQAHANGAYDAYAHDVCRYQPWLVVICDQEISR